MRRPDPDALHVGNEVAVMLRASPGALKGSSSSAAPLAFGRRDGVAQAPCAEQWALPRRRPRRSLGEAGPLLRDELHEPLGLRMSPAATARRGGGVALVAIAALVAAGVAAGEASLIRKAERARRSAASMAVAKPPTAPETVVSAAERDRRSAAAPRRRRPRRSPSQNAPAAPRSELADSVAAAAKAKACTRPHRRARASHHRRPAGARDAESAGRVAGAIGRRLAPRRRFALGSGQS